MAHVEQASSILTPEQAADYLQVNRETVYRYIRNGRLVASRLGRRYRIPRSSLERLLWQARTADDTQLGTFNDEGIAAFVRNVEVTDRSPAVAERTRSMSTKRKRRAMPTPKLADPHDIWRDYDPQKVLQAMHKARGAFAGVDTRALLEDLTAQRGQDSSGRPAD